MAFVDSNLKEQWNDEKSQCGKTKDKEIFLSLVFLISNYQKIWHVINKYIFFPPGDKNALQNIILYHLTPGVFIGKGFEPGVTNILKTTQGSKIYLKGVSSLEWIYDSIHLLFNYLRVNFSLNFSLMLPPVLIGKWYTSGEWSEIKRIWHHDNEWCHSCCR